MASLATIEELGARLVPAATPTGTEATRAQAILDDVSALARKLSGDTDRWTDDVADPTPADIVAVVLAAARRLFVNPNGFASEQDGDYSYRLPSVVLADGTFTSEERDLIRSYQDTPGLWTQQIQHRADTTRYNEGILERVWDATFGAAE